MAELLPKLDRFQVGKETTSGTAVAADTWIPYRMTFSPIDALQRPNSASGYTMRYNGFEVPVQRGTEIAIPSQPLYFETVPWLMSMSVQGSQTGAEQNVGEGDYLWDFERGISAGLTPDTYTLEHRMSSGGNNVDAEYPFVFCSGWEISWDQNDTAKVTASLMGRRRDGTSTLTGSVNNTTLSQAQTNRMAFYSDTSWAGIGGTQISTQILSGSIAYSSGLKPLYPPDDRDDLDFSIVVYDPNENHCTMSLTVLCDHSASNYFRSAQTAAEASTASAFRVAMNGDQIASGDDRYVYFDLYGKQEPGSYNVSGEVDGQHVVNLTLVETPDGSNPWFEVTTITPTASL